MLNWICPECGQENDPNLPECPACADPLPPPRFSAAPTPQVEVIPVAAGRVPLAPPRAATATFFTDFDIIETLPAAPVPAIPAIAAEYDGLEPRRASKVATELPEAAHPENGHALAIMVQAITAEPKPLGPALVVEDTPAQEHEPADLGVSSDLCGRIPQPELHITPRTGRVIIRARIWPEQYGGWATMPVSPDHEVVPVLPGCEEILLGRGPDAANPGPPLPRQPRALARSRRQLVLPSSGAPLESFVPAPLCGRLPMPTPVFYPRDMSGELRACGPMELESSLPALPSGLRRFQEAVVPRIAYMKRATTENGPIAESRRRVPAWAITIGTALGVLLVALFVVQRFATRSEVHAAGPRVPVATTSAPAWGAWPSIDKFVEVTGIRLTTDQNHSSEAVFTVVNHSAAEVGALSVKVTLPSANAADAPLCNVTTRVDTLAPWQAREVRVALPRELHAAELPDWHDMHPQVAITSAQ